MSEIWNPIPSCPGYSASSLGRIRLEPYPMQMPRGRGVRWSGGTPIKPSTTKGRNQVKVRCKTKKVAPLVCEAFHGPKPFPEAQCMHLDEDCSNDRPENLAWGTATENMNAPKLKEIHRARVAERHPRHKLSRAQVEAIRSARGSERAADLAVAYGIRRTYVHAIWSLDARRQG